MIDRPDDVLLAHYEQRLQEFGDSAPGADRPSEEDRRTRFDMMLDLIPDWRERGVVLCDLGCGTGELLAHLRRRGLHHIRYIGVDRSESALEIARRKFPGVEFVAMDVNDPAEPLERIACDYLVASGLFTVKASLTDEQMWTFVDSTLRAVWPQVRRGVAFNVMSTTVEWRRDELFHASSDELMRRLQGLVGRGVRLRADYGLPEMTLYAVRPVVQPARVLDEPAVVARLPTGDPFTPVMRPLLPGLAALSPYLERIDQNRTYSNFGPLAQSFEHRLAGWLASGDGSVAVAGSGYSALVGAMLASAGRARADRPLALLPAYTFVATAAAAEACGYAPWLADIDGESWLLDPERLADHPQLARIGLVVPVAAMGRAVPQAPWEAFSRRTGIPVVIDGAAAIEAMAARPDLYCGPLPVALSFHATKSFGVGEGGAVVATDIALVAAASRSLNFGFHVGRDCRSPSANGKLSEYHAAVGLAELDGWAEKQRMWLALAERYRQAFAARGVGDGLHTAPGIASSYVIYRAADIAQATRIGDALTAARLDFRLWYGLGLHAQTYYRDLPRDPLLVTDDLAPRLLGLPSAPDLSDAAITAAAAAVAAACR